MKAQQQNLLKRFNLWSIFPETSCSRVQVQSPLGFNLHFGATGGVLPVDPRLRSGSYEVKGAFK